MSCVNDGHFLCRYRGVIIKTNHFREAVLSVENFQTSCEKWSLWRGDSIFTSKAWNNLVCTSSKFCDLSIGGIQIWMHTVQREFGGHFGKIVYVWISISVPKWLPNSRWAYEFKFGYHQSINHKIWSLQIQGCPWFWSKHIISQKITTIA